jgi:hypothetical protein
MTKFKLSKEETGRTITRFLGTTTRGETVGVINVPNAEASDLQKHWAGTPATPMAKPVAKAADKAADSRAKISAALRKGPKLSKAALLRS